MAKKTSREIRVEYVPLGDVKKSSKNPKMHDLRTLEKSISRFGFVEPITINEETGEIVSGHGRLECLELMKNKGKAVPERIVEKNGEWWVPVEKGISMPRTDGEAYRVVSNRSTELGGWKEDMLADVLDSQNLEGIGFTERQISGMISKGIKDAPIFLEEDMAGGRTKELVCPKCGYRWEG